VPVRRRPEQQFGGLTRRGRSFVARGLRPRARLGQSARSGAVLRVPNGSYGVSSNGTTVRVSSGADRPFGCLTMPVSV
jgi:hypothetical protein